MNDSGGQPCFLDVMPMLHARGATVCMMVFAVPDLVTNEQDAAEEIRLNILSIASKSPEAPIWLVGTKNDLIKDSKESLQEIHTALTDFILTHCPAFSQLQYSESFCFLQLTIRRASRAMLKYATWLKLSRRLWVRSRFAKLV